MSKRVIGTGLVVMLVCVFVGLGFWQMQRWRDRRAHNALLVSRTALPPLDGPQLVRETDVSYRRGRLTGTYDREREFLLLSRAFKGVSGHHVLTPLLIDDGWAILVDRGWVPQDFLTEPSPHALPPPGDVVVEGVLVPDQTMGRYGPRPADEPPDPGVFRIDVARLRAHFPYELVPGYLQLATQQPLRDVPEPVPFPRPNDGPHLLYLIQWFLFAIATVTIAIARSHKHACAQVR